MEKEKKDLSLYGVKKYIHKNVLSRVEGEHLPLTPTHALLMRTLMRIHTVLNVIQKHDFRRC